jgi:hypothetical protein
MIFPTGRHQGKDVVLAMPLATLRNTKGSCSINTPWVILLWLALVEFLGLTTKEYHKHNDDKATMSTMTATTATATAATATTRMVVTMATTTKVTWTARWQQRRLRLQ